MRLKARRLRAICRERAERVNAALELGLTNREEIYQSAGLPNVYQLYFLQRKGYINLPKVRRGPVSGIRGRLAENKGLVDTLLHEGFPQIEVARTIGVRKQAIHQYLEDNPSLYRIWRRNSYAVS